MVHNVHTFEEFQSPIDKTIISDRRQLAEHNKKHGVAQLDDFSDDYIEKAKSARERENQKKVETERINDLMAMADAIEKRRSEWSLDKICLVTNPGMVFLF